MNPVSARLLGQQLICPEFTTPAEVVAWMGAMQAQDYRMMRWAVGMRCKRPSLKAFTQDFDEGRIVRTHLLRTTWQLVPGEDLGWMLNLCRDSALRGLRGWMNTNGVSIPQKEQAQVQEVFADVLSLKRSARKEDFAAALEQRGMDMDDHRLSYHIRLAEFGGLLCSGDLHPTKATYSLTEVKLPPQRTMNREEALAELARRYFRSHGPATLEDFVWWSGLGILDCRKGIEALGSELVQERCKHLNLYFYRDARIRGFRSGCLHLLPPYDEYLIGYKSRHVSLHPDHRHQAHNQRGIFWPVVLSDGQVVGNWSFANGVIRTEIFHPNVDPDPETLAREIARHERFLHR